MACAVLPYGAVRRDVAAGHLAARRIVDPEIARTVYLCCAESRLGTRALEAVCGEIRTLAAELVTSGAAGWAPCAGVPEGVTSGGGRPSDGGPATGE